MLTFNVVLRDASGRLASSQVIATSAEDAGLQITQNGCVLITCSTAPPPSWHALSARKKESRSRGTLDTAVFSQDLAALIDAGLSVKEALTTLVQREPTSTKRRTLQMVLQTVTEGKSLSQAMNLSGGFPELLLATVEASERTGDLGNGLARYADHQRNMQLLKDKLIGASVYPLVLLAVGGLVVMFLMGAVIPRFAGLMDGSRVQLPMLSSWLMAWGRIAAEHPSIILVVMVSVAIALALTIRHFRKNGLSSPWLQKLPYAAQVIREFQHLQLYRTTSILVARGIVIHRAMAQGAKLLGMKDRTRLEKAIVLMQEGHSISAALSGAGLSDVLATSMLKVAEQTGSMSEMLERIAQFYERKLQRSIDIATRVIEPALMIVIGTVIGAIVVLMYLPIFDLASSLS